MTIKPGMINVKEIIDKSDLNRIEEIANNLYNENQEICVDCLKILTQIGEHKPVLIEKYVYEFLKLVQINNEELNYHALLALNTLVHIKAEDIYDNCAYILDVIETKNEAIEDIGIKIIAILATKSEKYSLALFPYLVSHLRASKNEKFPVFAEYILQAATPENKEMLNGPLKERLEKLDSQGAKRINEVLRKLEEV